MNRLTFSRLQHFGFGSEAVRKTQNNQYYSLQLQGSQLSCADTPHDVVAGDPCLKTNVISWKLSRVFK